MTEIKIHPTNRRLIHSKLAQFCEETNGCDMYHFMQAFWLLLSYVGEQPLKDHYKEKYSTIKKHLIRITKQYQKIKIYYDSLPKIKNQERTTKIEQLYDEELKKLNLITSTPFKSFHLILDKTDMRLMPIVRDAFKTAQNQLLKTSEGDKQLEN